MMMEEMLKDLEKIIEHSRSDVHKAAQQEENTPAEIEAVKNIAKLAYYYQILKAMDEDGKYSGRYGSSYRGYYDYGSSGRRRRDGIGRYSGSHEDMMDTLQRMMRQTNDDQELYAIRECLDMIEQM